MGWTLLHYQQQGQLVDTTDTVESGVLPWEQQMVARMAPESAVQFLDGHRQEIELKTVVQQSVLPWYIEAEITANKKTLFIAVIRTYHKSSITVRCALL